jgi:hypothetical protein
MDIVNNKISFRVPHVVKGAKSKRAKNVVEKKTRKKNKGSHEKGRHCCLYCFFFALSCFFNSCKYIPGGNNLLIFYMSQL